MRNGRIEPVRQSSDESQSDESSSDGAMGKVRREIVMQGVAAFDVFLHDQAR